MERLLNLPREDTATLENVDIKEAMRITEQRGEELNRDNPWADSTARKDKLRARLGFWKAIGTDRHTLSWLAYGKKLSFITPPENLSFPNHPSTRPHDAFIAEEAEKGLADGSFFRAHHSFARVINPTQIEPKGKGKLRYCHDIRYPNSLTATAPFRLSTLARNLHTVLLDGDLLVVSDLEKAYYSVPMHPDSWPYLCFDTPIGLMAGTCLLFGDAQAPFTFHKITRHIVAFAGRLGVRVLSYLDDFLWMAQPNKIAQTSAFAQWILPLLGWSLNQKCDFTPSTFKKFLGFYVDSEAMRLKAPFRKVRETSRMIRDTITTGAATVKHLQSIAGKIISLRLAIPGTRAWTRSTNELIAKATREGQAGSTDHRGGGSRLDVPPNTYGEVVHNRPPAPVGHTRRDSERRYGGIWLWGTHHKPQAEHRARRRPTGTLHRHFLHPQGILRADQGGVPLPRNPERQQSPLSPRLQVPGLQPVQGRGQDTGARPDVEGVVCLLHGARHRTLLRVVAAADKGF